MRTKMKMNNNLAPIVLFVYNRPSHTRQTVEALKHCKQAVGSDLYVFADGPKENASAEIREKISEVREFIHSIDGFRSVTIEEAEKNKGLANSVIAGVSKVVERYGRVIVVEDDLIVSSHFLGFMNQSLDLYEHDGKVLCINGYSIVKEPPIKQSTYFQYGADCQGWATWQRGWDVFVSDAQYLMDTIIQSRKLRSRFTYHGTYPYVEMLQNQIDGKIDSWAIRWYASALIKGGLCLYPSRSLVQNIGFGDGTHCHDDNCYQATVVADESITDFPRIRVRDSKVMRKEYEKLYEKLFGRPRRPLWKQFKRTIKRLIKPVLNHSTER